MSRFQSKITCHHKSQKDLKLNEKKKSIDVNTKTREMLELSHNDFKETMMKRLQ